MVTRLRQESPSFDVLHTLNLWSYNGWFRRGSTWELQNLVICRFRSWGTWQSINKWMPPCTCRTQYLLSTHSFFKEADFNGYVVDRGWSHCGEPCFACCWFTFLLPVVSHTSHGEIALNKSSPAEWKLGRKTPKKWRMIIGSTFLTPSKLPEFMSNPGISCLRDWQDKGTLSWKRKLVMLSLTWHGTGRLLTLMLSMALNGPVRLSSGFPDQTRLTTGLSHVRSGQLQLISSMWDLKSRGMRVCTWRDQVVLRSFSLRTIKPLLESLKVVGHRHLDTLTKHKDWTCHGCLSNSNENISDWSMLVHHFKQLTSSPSPLPTPRSGNQLCDWWVFHHSLLRRRIHRRWKPAQGNLHALMRPEPSNPQGNLLALQWHLIAGYSLNFVADLIQSLVIGQESIPKIVVSSDVLKKGILHLGRIEWTFEMKWFKPLDGQLFNPVLFWSGSVSLALVAQHGHM